MIASQQNSALFSDKEQIWADNAESSPFFGNAYVCYAGVQRASARGSPPSRSTSSTSTRRWRHSGRSKKVTTATNNINSQHGFGRSGCTVRTDSRGDRVRVRLPVRVQRDYGRPTARSSMIRSLNGGATWQRPGRPVHGEGCAASTSRTRSGAASWTASGVPATTSSPDPSRRHRQRRTRAARTRRIRSCSPVDGAAALNDEHVLFSTSTDGGDTWTELADVTRRATAATTRLPRSRRTAPTVGRLQRVHHAVPGERRRCRERPAARRRGPARDVGPTARWVRSPRSIAAPSGDARSSSQNNLATEFLGDYVYAAATRTYGAAVWNDVRDGGRLSGDRHLPAGTARPGGRDRRADRRARGAERCRGVRARARARRRAG